MSRKATILATLLLVLAGVGGVVATRFHADLQSARERAARGALVAETRCGPIEYEDAGAGVPLLVIHGAGGGHDQGMAFGRPLLQHGVRVIAPSRFGYLGTPLPADASPAAQADANICLLDALGIERAAVIGISAGGPSSLQTAIRHPERVTALLLVAPLTYTPRLAARYGAPPSAADRFQDWMVGSDFVYWTMMHVARDLTIARVLGTPPALVARAGAADRARVQAMLEDILPVSARATGLRNESWQATHLRPDALDRIVAPTLIISARDDGYGTFANAEYTAPRIAGARFIRFEQGGHMLVGHDAETMRALLAHLRDHAGVAPARPAG
jgi:pimeloyl-ACP methyl ester carboxylesterase